MNNKLWNLYKESNEGKKVISLFKTNITNITVNATIASAIGLLIQKIELTIPIKMTIFNKSINVPPPLPLPP